MADYYCDVSAVGNEYQAYAATPTWGALSTDKPLPMDGTGLAGPGHSAAVAIAEIQITVLPADTNTLVLAGATLTAKTTAAAKNQWTITGAISTCVTNLVALLNTFGTGTAQCDAAVSTSVSKLALALPYWQFARVKPGTTDTIQIATRFAGADLNYASNANVAITTSGWGTPPTITQFAGGANGPFAYLYNTTTVFGKSDGQASGTAGPGYGLLFAAAPGPSEPGLTDTVHCRTKRSSADLTVTAWTVTGANTNTATYISRSYLFDNGTIWSNDNGKLTIGFKRNSWNSGSIVLFVPAGALAFTARTKGGFEIQFSVASGSGNVTLFQAQTANSGVALTQSRVIETSDHAGVGQLIVFAGAGSVSNVHCDLSGTFVQFRGSVTNRFLMNSGGVSTLQLVRLNGLEIEVVAATSAIGTMFSFSAGSGYSSYEWIGGYIRDSLGVYSCEMPFSINTAAPVDILIDSVDGVTNPSISWTASNIVNASLRWNQPEGANKGYRVQTPRFMVDWKASGFPYSTAADLRGNGWSHRVTWTAQPQAYGSVTVLRFGHFYRSAAAAKTIKLSLYVPDATTFYDDELEFEVTYLDSTDVIRTERAAGSRAQQGSATRTALAADSATWTANGVASHSAKKLELTTAHSIKQNSEITARLSLAKTRSPSVTFYASPELVLS